MSDRTQRLTIRAALAVLTLAATGFAPGCGLAKTLAALALLSSGGSSTPPAAPSAVVAVVEAPARAIGDVEVRYRLVDPGDAPADVTIEYSTDGGASFTAAKAADPLGER